MKNLLNILTLLVILLVSSCQELLEPEPIDLLSDVVALNEAADVESARIGMYAALRSIASPKVIAGDFTADMLIHNGTFTQYREISNKQITASNASVNTLWGAIYGTIYVTNSVLEKLPEIQDLRSERRELVTAEAQFIRGYALFVAYTTFGKAPIPTTSDITVNRSIPRSPVSEVVDQVLDDFEASIDGLPSEGLDPGFLTCLLYTSDAADD